jgi:GT2 family glycosyltransferase
MLNSTGAVPLSIVIPTQQRADLLQLCLESVSRFAPPKTEIIVVDDGSPEAVASFAALNFRGVRAIRLPRTQGFCVAANRGIAAARGEIIELLNDDTQVERGWAEAAIECFADPAVGAVAPLVLRGTPGAGTTEPAAQARVRPKPLLARRAPRRRALGVELESPTYVGELGPEIDSAGDSYDPGGFAWKNGHRQRLTDEYLQRRPVAAASASSVFLRRTALERSRLFSERFGAYFEDVDLSLRLRAAGYRIIYEPASRIWHRGGSSYGPARRRLVERQSCNEERLFWRHLHCPGRWKKLARHLAVLGGKAVRRCREGTLIPFLMGRLRALTEIYPVVSQKEDCSCPILPPRGRS